MTEIINNDSLIALKQFPDNHFDSVVTDPPYGLSFMNKKWDYDVPSVELWKEVLRVLKPGGYILCACGTRTQHRMAVGLEDAGFEIRDIITWHYASGFPKSYNISKGIDSKAGAERQVVSQSNRGTGAQPSKLINHDKGDTGIGYMDGSGKTFDITAPATEEAKKWDGWGTALKPATELFTLARKPLSENTIVDNVLKYGTGGINIDGTRIGRVEGDRTEYGRENLLDYAKESYSLGKYNVNTPYVPDENGRFPANVIFDEFTSQILDEQSGITKSGKVKNDKPAYKGDSTTGFLRGVSNSQNQHGDMGGASRFFFCAKASSAERNKGLDDFEVKQSSSMPGRRDAHDMSESKIDNDVTGRFVTHKKNFHPTVKPIKLMQYLVKLITPPGGICLDPFNGSGSTGIACELEGFNYVGIEREKDYCDISEARIKAYEKQNTEVQDSLFA